MPNKKKCTIDRADTRLNKQANKQTNSTQRKKKKNYARMAISAKTDLGGGFESDPLLGSVNILKLNSGIVEYHDYFACLILY